MESIKEMLLATHVVHQAESANLPCNFALGKLTRVSASGSPPDPFCFCQSQIPSGTSSTGEKQITEQNSISNIINLSTCSKVCVEPHERISLIIACTLAYTCMHARTHTYTFSFFLLDFLKIHQIFHQC